MLTVLQLFGAIHEEYNFTRALLHAADDSQRMLLARIQQRIKLTVTPKRRSGTSGISWDMIIRYANAADFVDLCATLSCLVDELRLGKGGAGLSRTPGSLQITLDRGSTLSVGRSESCSPTPQRVRGQSTSHSKSPSFLQHWSGFELRPTIRALTILPS